MSANSEQITAFLKHLQDQANIVSDKLLENEPFNWDDFNIKIECRGVAIEIDFNADFHDDLENILDNERKYLLEQKEL